MTDDLLVRLVKEATGGDSWNEGAGGSITLRDGKLVVSQTPSVHREIRTLLSRLGDFR